MPRGGLLEFLGVRHLAHPAVFVALGIAGFDLVLYVRIYADGVLPTGVVAQLGQLGARDNCARRPVFGQPFIHDLCQLPGFADDDEHRRTRVVGLGHLLA